MILCRVRVSMKKTLRQNKKGLFFSFLRFWYSMQSSPVFMWRIMTKNKRRLSTTTSRVVCFSNHSTVLENHQKCLTFISATYFMDCTRTHCYGGIDFRLCETIVWKWDFLTFFNHCGNSQCESFQRHLLFKDKFMTHYSPHAFCSSSFLLL